MMWQTLTKFWVATIGMLGPPARRVWVDFISASRYHTRFMGKRMLLTSLFDRSESDTFGVFVLVNAKLNGDFDTTWSWLCVPPKIYPH